MIRKNTDFNKRKIVLDSKQENNSENYSEIVMTKAENNSEIKIENKKIYSLSLDKKSRHRHTDVDPKNIKAEISVMTRAENKIKKTFQILSKENNIIEWKADQQKEIRIIC